MSGRTHLQREHLYGALGEAAILDIAGGGNANMIPIRGTPWWQIASPIVMAEATQIGILVRYSGRWVRFVHTVVRDHFAYRWAPIALQSDDPEMRDRGAWVLWQIPNPECVPLLLPVLRDPYRYARGSAISGLGRIGDVRALNPLRELLDDKTPVQSVYGRRIMDLAERAIGEIEAKKAGARTAEDNWKP